MKTAKKLLLSGVLFLSLVTPVLAQSSSRIDSSATGALISLYLAFIGAYYCLICLGILALFMHAILSVVCILDIMKRGDNELNKEMWILLIILPGTLPFISWLGGVFVSVGLELYYLLVKRNKLSN